MAGAEVAMAEGAIMAVEGVAEAAGGSLRERGAVENPLMEGGPLRLLRFLPEVRPPFHALEFCLISFSFTFDPGE